MTQSSLFDPNFEEALSYSDVFIVPKHSNIVTRKDVDIGASLGPFATSLVPVISANMESVTGVEMCCAMRDAGALAAMHRFQSIEDAVESFKQNQTHCGLKKLFIPPIVSVGVNRDSYERACALYEAGARYFVIDIAHGHSVQMKNMIKYMKGMPGVFVIAGNIATSEAAYDLVMWGADAVKAGIGPGSVCLTKNVTGVTVPGFQSVVAAKHGALSAQIAIDVWNHQHGQNAAEKYVPVIADGGMLEIGDICKALGAGADFIMSGRFFAGCDEAPNGTVYRGSASQDLQEKYRNDKQMPTPEGKSDTLEPAGPVAGVVEAISGGIRSAMSYVGARNMEEFHQKCTFGVRKS